MLIQHLGQRLKHFRQARQLTQCALAELAEVPQPIISALEAGKRTGITFEVAGRLARALAVSLDQLAGTAEAEAELRDLVQLPKTSRGRPRKQPVATAG